MNAASKKSRPTISSGTTNVIFSLALVGGLLLLVSPAGRMIANSGPARRRANRSPSQDSSAAQTTSGIYGPTTFASCVPDGPLSSWESRLRQRLARIGSTECWLTWRAMTTPAGRSYSQLAPSTGRTVEIESFSSPIETALWITASARDWKDSPGMATKRDDGRSRIDQLPRQAAAALWTTPTAHQQAAKFKQGGSCTHSQILALGLQDIGSSDTTEKPGAFNPRFACWLMGFPLAWDDCAPTEMPSSRNSRRKP